MMDFKFYVILGVIVAFIGGFIGGAGAVSGNVVSSVVFLYIFAGIAAIIILWGFAGVIDKINDNTENIAQLLKYFTDSLEVIESEGSSKETSEEAKQSDVSYE
jgi:hypothetical protein